MKRSLIYLISLWLVMGLAGCTTQLEPSYEPVVIVPTQDTAVSQPPPALVHVTTQPTRAINTATAVLTETATITATAVQPTGSARETPTNMATAPATTISADVPTVSPTAPFTQTTVVTATTPATHTLPNAQTPTPGWHYYVSDPHGLMMQIPSHWLPSPDFRYRSEGSDGFVELLATNSQDNLLLNACQDMALAFGTAVPIEWLTVAGQEACLITADDGSIATLIVQFPELRENIVPGVAYAFLVLQADPAHMSGFVQTLYFMPVTAVP